MNNENCPTCNGVVFVEKLGVFVKTRETVGLVCQTCGHDYGSEETDAAIPSSDGCP